MDQMLSQLSESDRAQVLAQYQQMLAQHAADTQHMPPPDFMSREEAIKSAAEARVAQLEMFERELSASKRSGKPLYLSLNTWNRDGDMESEHEPVERGALDSVRTVYSCGFKRLTCLSLSLSL